MKSKKTKSLITIKEKFWLINFITVVIGLDIKNQMNSVYTSSTLFISKNSIKKILKS